MATNNIRIGTLTPSKMYVGANEILKEYVGTNLVYEAGAAPITVVLRPTAYDATTWATPANAVDASETTVSSRSTAVVTSYPITIHTLTDLSSVPDNAIISEIGVRVNQKINNTSRGTLTGTCSLGALTITKSTSQRNDTTTFAGTWGKSTLTSFTATFTPVRTTNTFIAYLYYVDVTVIYTMPE